jgi:hypothetical protein
VCHFVREENTNKVQAYTTISPEPLYKKRKLPGASISNKTVKEIPYWLFSLALHNPALPYLFSRVCQSGLPYFYIFIEGEKHIITRSPPEHANKSVMYTSNAHILSSPSIRLLSRCRCTPSGKCHLPKRQRHISSLMPFIKLPGIALSNTLALPILLPERSFYPTIKESTAGRVYGVLPRFSLARDQGVHGLRRKLNAPSELH